jgi:hypothetical protein
MVIQSDSPHHFIVGEKGKTIVKTGSDGDRARREHEHIHTEAAQSNPVRH